MYVGFREIAAFAVTHHSNKDKTGGTNCGNLERCGRERSGTGTASTDPDLQQNTMGSDLHSAILTGDNRPDYHEY